MEEEKKTKQTKKSEEKSVKTQKTTKNASKNAKKVEKSEENFKNIKILGYNDLKLNVYVFDKVENPKAVVLLIHGMQEHCLRYQNFAEFLNKNGYIVVMSDLRGHGLTAISKDKLGFGEKDIMKETIADQKNIVEYIKENYKLPIYLFAHSYGSLASQNLIQQCPDLEKIVLCGTTNGSSTVMKLGRFVIALLSPFKKYDSKGGIVEKLCVASYGKKFKDGNWLTRDEKQYEKYLKDEYCGGSFPFSFYKSMIGGMKHTNKGVASVKGQKVFFIAGDKDPVGENGKQVKKLWKLYKKRGVDAKIKLYKDARHELINETCRDEVYQDVLDFYNN